MNWLRLSLLRLTLAFGGGLVLAASPAGASKSQPMHLTKTCPFWRSYSCGDKRHYGKITVIGKGRFVQWRWTTPDHRSANVFYPAEQKWGFVSTECLPKPLPPSPYPKH
jgi:hypothetical protein